MSESVYSKCVEVINSCETKEQLEVAEKYLRLAAVNGYMGWTVNDVIWSDVFLTRYKKITAGSGGQTPVS